ncbi:MAG: GlcG/HbpS family heme-binding protein [Acidimicrobiales bacterium]
MSITLEQALAVLAAGEKRAAEMKVPMAIAVVDDGGNLKAQHRMDGASLAAIEVSLSKAYTAVATNSSTEDLAGQCQPGQPLYGLQATHNGRIVIFGGGVPLHVGGELVGAVGASAGTVAQDIDVAETAAAAIEAA